VDQPAEHQPVAVITGAARGMGAAIARRLAGRGYRVALIDIPDADASRTAVIPGPYRPATEADLEQATAACGGAGESWTADVRDGGAVTTVVDAVVERHGRLDVAIAAAGAGGGGEPVWQTSDEVWAAMIDINLTGAFHLARAAVPHLLARPEPRNGRFVAIASAASHHGIPMMAAYTAAKHGVSGLVKSLSAELGPTGVTANAVAPGSTQSAMLEASAEIYNIDDIAAFGRQARIRRLIQPDEIASAVEWLAVDAPGALTGAILDVDGGFRI
jgi:SDR family mycofactocin-dependent oxidoreductase